MDAVTIVPLTRDRWPDLDGLFTTSGPVGRCWCMYWRIGATYRRRPPEDNRADFFTVVSEGPPPGLLALDGSDLAVGWCQVTPKTDLPTLSRRRGAGPPGPAPTWALSCLYVRKGHRKQGVATALIAAAVDWARQSGAASIEAYPVDRTLSSSTSHTGFASTFERLGFATVARDPASRPTMRLTLQMPH